MSSLRQHTSFGVAQGFGHRGVFRLAVVLVALALSLLVSAGCTSAKTEELLETHPVLSDLQLETAERIDRSVMSSHSSAFPSGDKVFQDFVPIDGATSFEDIVEEALAIAEELDWELVYYESEVTSSKWSGCKPAPSDPDLGHRLTIRISEQTTVGGGAPKRVTVDLMAGREC